LLDFLEQALQTPVDLRLSLLAATPEEMAQAQGGPTRALSPFEIDMQNEPIIGTLLRIFEAEPVGMRRLARDAEFNPETSEPGDSE